VKQPTTQRETPTIQTRYDGLALLADPIHGCIPFTAPVPGSTETTEKAIIDSAWMQRLRYINQLQSARWVYPSAEHSRFVHSLGAMHVAGRFARALYPSLAQAAPGCPSAAAIESLMRITALVHDVGHGPFCHFFDHQVLHPIGLTHEKLGQEIIRRALAPQIAAIRRSPEGNFSAGEALDPEHVAFLIHKDPAYKTPASLPRWLILLKPLFSGLFTADNLDYVLRDAYMCGVAIGPVDLDRILHYTFVTPHGLTLHRAGLSALAFFLGARSYLYSNVYYHRTTRAIDLHLADIFPETIREIFPHSPLARLEDYLDLTDWSLLTTVKGWKTSRSKKRRALSMEWNALLRREVKWKMAYETVIPSGGDREAVAAETVALAIRARLPKRLNRLAFRVDMASQDPRPLHPMRMGERQIYIFNPATQTVGLTALADAISALPPEVIQCRVYTEDHQHDALLSKLAEDVLKG